MNNFHQNITIIGGGVAGLALALALKRSEVDVTIYERSAHNSFAGMGFLLGSPGVKVLEELIGLESLNACGLRVKQLTLVNDHTQRSVSVPGDGGMMIRRPDLINVLEDRCRRAGVRLSFNQELIQVIKNEPTTELAGSALTLTLRDHNAGHDYQVQCEQIIGADGVHSLVRRTLFPPAEFSAPQLSEFVGVCEWRLDNDDSSESQLIKIQRADQRQAFGYARLDTHRVIWYAQLPLLQAPNLQGTPEQKAKLVDLYEGWSPLALGLIKATTSEMVYRWDNSDLNLLESPYNSSALLIGDAAHASLTISSHGVSSALRDSQTLARLAHLQLNAQGHLDWMKLCEDFTNTRAPIWSAQQSQARYLLREYLSGGNTSVPYLSSRQS